MKFENISVMNFENALRGMRNPKNSWHLSDTYEGFEYDDTSNIYSRTNQQPFEVIKRDNDLVHFISIGPNDMDLARRLIKGGSEHRKFLRQIFASVDITAPLYWWKEFDTYKVATTANSTSTMHKILSKEIDFSCFETGDFNGSLQLIDPAPIYLRVDSFLDDLEQMRQLAIMYEEKAKKAPTEDERKKYYELSRKYWKELIRWLPEGWLQTRTWTGNYENLASMYHQRENHKLIEWKEDFITFIDSLPYSKELIKFDFSEKI